MSAAERRLAKVQAGLSPKEAVLAWMAEAHAHGSLRAYVASLRGAPEAAFPLIRLGRQMESAVRAERRGRPEAETWRAVRLAVRDASFLYYLASNLNWKALEHRKANWLHLALVAHMLSTALDREDPAALRAALEQAEAAVHTLYVQQGVVQSVAERYFEGADPLFPDVATELAEQLAELERVLGVCNQMLVALAPEPRNGKRARQEETWPVPLELGRVRREAGAAMWAELAVAVDLAKAEALRLIGEQDQGYALVGRHVWQDAP